MIWSRSSCEVLEITDQVNISMARYCTDSAMSSIIWSISRHMRANMEQGGGVGVTTWTIAAVYVRHPDLIVVKSNSSVKLLLSCLVTFVHFIFRFA